jgi:hypothetical protein
MDGALNIKSLKQDAEMAAKRAVESWSMVWDSDRDMPRGYPQRLSAVPEFLWEREVEGSLESDETLAAMFDPFVSEAQRLVADHIGFRWEDL